MRKMDIYELIIHQSPYVFYQEENMENDNNPRWSYAIRDDHQKSNCILPYRITLCE